jgi:lipopolysaccharide/colanic/teichoic acid biosynthesis glycosyltransferase
MLNKQGIAGANHFITRLTRQYAESYYFRKRVLDIVVSAALLVVVSPLMLLIAIWIKLDSQGPVLFIQERVGARRRRQSDGSVQWEVYRFRMYKFRSMIHNASVELHRDYVQAFIRNDQGAMDSIQGTATSVRKLVADPRVTRAGRFLRRTSLDELPQLWNVLKGEMSLVGPRPALSYEVEVYEAWHRKRLEAIPGLTGPWQVTARNAANFDEMVQMDIQYIQRQSLRYDIKILLLTPLAAVQHRGAA